MKTKTNNKGKGGESMEEYELIEEFILEAQQGYPQLDMKFEYNEVTGEYEIVFDTTESDYPRRDVEETLNELAEEMLVREGVFNFFMCHELALSEI